MKAQILVLILAVLIGPSLVLSVRGAERGDDFAKSAAARVESKPSVRGDDGNWFFLVPELRHVSKGDFWNQPWEEIAVNGVDPVPSLLEFHEMLAGRGVHLLLVPIPTKASIYPEKLDTEFGPGDTYGMKPFIDQLRKKGLDVLDLETVFLNHRGKSPTPKLYCAQDAHYSPAAIEIVADQIGEHLDWEESSSHDLLRSAEKTLSIVGDQVMHSEWEGQVSSEELPVRFVSQGGTPGIQPDPSSPVLLLGDSHTLVFQEGKESGMHCKGAGLSDHLSFRLGARVDLVGGRGSGMVQSRKSLFFHATGLENYWVGKKLVIWVFSVREFTESTDRPVSIPLDR